MQTKRSQFQQMYILVINILQLTSEHILFLKSGNLYYVHRFLPPTSISLLPGRTTTREKDRAVDKWLITSQGLVVVNRVVKLSGLT